MFTKYFFLLFFTLVCATNVVKNYSFENGSTGWTISGNGTSTVTSAQRYQGFYSLELGYSQGGIVSVSTNFTIPYNATATLMPNYKCSTTPATIRFYVDNTQ